MTRINTNVSSLLAQNNLAQANNQLQTSLTRLSTGLRINSGADDPAGLVAATNLGSDITSANQAISNNQQATQMISTADSALGQVSSLLNTVRGLVTQAASTGTMSSSAIAANQSQVDSALSAINQIAQTTTFQGQNLLNGQLNFKTNFTSGGANVTDMQVNQVNMGTAATMPVNVAVTTGATQATLTTGISAAAAAAAPASATVTTNNGHFTVTANANGPAFNGKVVIQQANLGGGANDETAQWIAGQNGTPGELLLTFDSADATTDLTNAALGTALTAAGFTVSNTAGDWTPGTDAVTGPAQAASLAHTLGGGSQITIADNATGFAGNNVTVTLAQNAAAAGVTTSWAGSAAAVTVGTLNGEPTVGQIVSAVNSAGASPNADNVTATLTAGNSGSLYVAGNTFGPTHLAGGTPASAAPSLTGGAVVTTGAGLASAVSFEVSGALGSQVFSFAAGQTAAQIAAAVNQATATTGVSAAAGTTVANNTPLTFTSTGYGSDATVGVSVVGNGALGTGLLNASSNSASQATGTDVAGTINGIAATGKDNTLSVNTPSLNMSLSVANGYSGNIAFTINGGGALFQVGPDVESSQQVQLGIPSVDTGSLGGADGKLFQIGTGGSAALATNPATAENIVNDAQNEVTNLRARLGGFQSETLDSNVATLTGTVQNLTAAQSDIQDADFAAESANLTRAQILVQSGTSVLSIANHNPQNVLSLLQNT